MALSDEMRRLTRHFVEAYDDRSVAESARRAQAATDASGRGQCVATLKSDTAAFMGGTHQANQQMAAETARELTEFHAAHEAMATELTAHLDEQESERRAQATEDTQGRAEYVDGLHRDTAVFFKELDSAHQAMAAELTAHLDEQESERRAQATEDAQGRAEYVDGLHRDTAVFFKDLDSVHQAMAAELRAHLDEQESERRAQAPEDARGRAEYVDRLESDVAAMRGRLQVNLSEARQAWSSFAGQMQERRAGRPVAAPPPPPPPPPTEEVASDDLTVIRGIGSGTQRRLNEAGIFTYAQLAESTPEELRQVLGEGPQATKAGEWIEQAQGLVE